MNRGMTANLRPFKLADLFCGAGGSSTGAERAIKKLGRRMELVCVNHWPVAIETHRRNHPTARHYIEDVMVADPEKLVPEGRLDLLMASPECKYHSRARGGKPVNDQCRMNPWAVQKWLTALKVRIVLIENVPEFIHWGPLLPDGRPDPKKRGWYFQAWFKTFNAMGYKAEWRYLNAADYGDATTRVRFFLIARRDGRNIRWPHATHSEAGGQDMIERMEKWRAAREIIDLDNAGRSLMDDPKYRRRPLSVNTLRRIARGLEKFGGPLAPLYIQLLGLKLSGDGEGDGTAFVMGKNGNSPAYRSVTSRRGSGLVDPILIQTDQTGGNGPYSRSVEDPVPTLVTKANVALVEPVAVPAELGDIDPRRLVEIDGRLYVLDIRFRMLNNQELSRAMSFTDNEYTYEFVGNGEEVTKQIGNAVPVRTAQALVTAILSG